MLIGDFHNVIKRETRYGTVGTTNDQATLDILNEINIRRKRLWAFANWPWALEKLAFVVNPSTTIYLVKAASANLVDRITELIPQDATTNPPTWGAPLQELERSDFYAWWASQPPPQSTPDIPQKYVNLGLDPAGSGLWQIEVAPIPSTAFTMKGFAKKLLKTFVLADIIANTALDYFPDGVIEDVLIDGVKAGVYAIQGYDDKSARYDQAFESKLKMLKEEQSNAGRDDSGIQSPVPDPYRFKARNRNKNGTGVF